MGVEATEARQVLSNTVVAVTSRSNRDQVVAVVECSENSLVKSVEAAAAVISNHKGAMVEATVEATVVAVVVATAAAQAMVEEAVMAAVMEEEDMRSNSLRNPVGWVWEVRWPWVRRFSNLHFYDA